MKDAGEGPPNEEEREVSFPLELTEQQLRDVHAILEAEVAKLDSIRPGFPSEARDLGAKISRLDGVLDKIEKTGVIPE